MVPSVCNAQASSEGLTLTEGMMPAPAEESPLAVSRNPESGGSNRNGREEQARSKVVSKARRFMMTAPAQNYSGTEDSTEAKPL
jgi:hypothetical protein